MQASAVLDEILSVAQRPGPYVNQAKAAGKRVVGCVHCMPGYVPEEILDAGGVLPVGVWGGEKPIARAESLMQPFACSMARSALELGMEGVFDDLDGFAFSTCCDTIKNLAEIWKAEFPGKFYRTVVYPATPARESSKVFMASQIKGFAGALADWTALAITDADLESSIAKYEGSRTAIKGLASVRARHPKKMRAREFAGVVRAASIMERGEYAKKVHRLTETLAERDDVLTGERRVLVTGTLPMPVAFLDAIENAGGVVVADDLGLGGKYYERSIEKSGSPWDRLAASLLSHSPASTIHHGKETRAKHLLALAEEHDASAVIVNATKFCEPEFFDQPDLKKDLEAAGMPSLLLETEMVPGGGGTLSTRIGAFLESLD